ncbi:MAG TPA: hypothetical protein VHS99_06110 [Chloroflexota bacterium]|nr:hypothetical protein [Chloroflexota bacterium]
MSTEERKTPAQGAEDSAHQEEAGGAEQAETAGGGDERMRILRLVAEGRITVEQAAELLSALEPPPGQAASEAVPPGPDFRVGVSPPSFGPGFPFGTTGPARPGAPFPPGPGAPTMFAYAARGARGPRGARTAPAPPPGTHVEEGDVLFWRPGVDPAVAGRTLNIEVSREGQESKARIPLGLIAEADRFLPRQAREVLEECDIDLKSMLQNLASVGLENLPLGVDLIHIEEGDGHLEVKVRIEE